ncbi:MAG TPA: hypothetical protein EYN66_23470 [Myxococcales bacterium]|nr:hypothetical protein [Myxococcales bacterium]
MRIAVLALMFQLALGCGGSEWTSLAGGEFKFPDEHVVSGAAMARISGVGMDTLTSHIGQLLPALAGNNDSGWTCINVDQLLESGVINIPIALGPFTADLAARELELCIDLKEMDVKFVEGSQPAALLLTVSHARVALAKPAVLSGTVQFLGITGSAACRIDNNVDLDGPFPFLSEVSFTTEAVIDVSDEGYFSLKSTSKNLTIHELGAKVTQDCSLPECSDKNPGNIGDPCLECDFCTNNELHQSVLTFLKNTIDQLFDPLLGAVFDSIGALVLDELLNGRPLNISASVSLANLMSAVSSSARSVSNLGLLIRPAPQGFLVDGSGTDIGLTIRLAGGTLAGAVHPCAANGLDTPSFSDTPFPDLPITLPDGSNYDLALAVSEPFLNQLLWSSYASGALCLGLTTREIATLTASSGSLSLRAGALDILFPGVTALAKRSASVRIRLLPTLKASDFPLLSFSSNSGGISLNWPRFTLAMEVFADGAYMRISTITADVSADLSIQPIPGEGLEITINKLELAQVEVSASSFESVRVEEIIQLALELLLKTIGSAHPFNLQLDAGFVDGFLGGLPLVPQVADLTVLGTDKRWLGIFLTLSSGAEKPLGEPMESLPLIQLQEPQSNGCHAGRQPVLSTSLLGISFLLLLAIGMRAYSRRLWLLLLLFLSSCTPLSGSPVACNSHADCPSGLTCNPKTAQCISETPCTTDDDCCLNTVCFNGACRVLEACSKHSECLEDQICDQGQCEAKACNVDAPCHAPYHQCVGGLCVREVACGGCPSGRVCEPQSGRCVDSCQGFSCPDGQFTAVSDPTPLSGLGCHPEEVTCQCVSYPPLAPAAPGPWLNLVEAEGGVIWMIARDMRYGDLVQRKLESTDQGQSELLLDGRPPGPVVGAISGPRGGVSAPGPDVGYFVSSVRLNDSFVTLYQDADRELLKAAVSSPQSLQVVYELDATPGSGFGTDLIVDLSSELHTTYMTRTQGGTATLFYAHSKTPGSVPLSPENWLIHPVSKLGGVPLFEAPCDGKCMPTEVCVMTQAAPECQSPDLLSQCDPSCDLSSLCVGGVCSVMLRSAANVLPWRDEPGNDAAIAIWGNERLIAFHDHFSGSLKLARAAKDQAFSLLSLAGGKGHDIGHHVEIDAIPGFIAVAYQDATREIIHLMTGVEPAGLKDQEIATGGSGIALRIRSDGTILLAFGQPNMEAVQVWHGHAENLELLQLHTGGSVGRFNALLLSSKGPILATLRDNLSAELEINPQIESVNLTDF